MATWKPLDQMKYVGRDVPRVDGPEKVKGSAKFTQDVQLAGMLHGMILRSPHAHAYVRSIDLSKAERLPGVKAVLKLDKYTVRYQGEEVAAIAAESPEIAGDALRLIEVKYEVLPYAVIEEEAMAEGAASIGGDGNVSWDNNGDKAAVEKLLEASAHVVEQEVRVQVQVHNCLETHSAVAGGRMARSRPGSPPRRFTAPRMTWSRSSSSTPKKWRLTASTWAAVSAASSRSGVEALVAARLSRMTGKPVRVAFDRKGEYLSAGNRPSLNTKIRIGCDAAGKLTAFAEESNGTAGISGGSGVPTPYIYNVPEGAVFKRHANVRINAGEARPMRAPGHPQAQFATEILIDMLAEKAGIDPVEFRMLNIPSAWRHHQQLKLGVERIGWSRRRNATPGAGEGPIKRGIGVGCGVWGGGGARSTKVQVEIMPGWQRADLDRHPGPGHRGAHDDPAGHRGCAGNFAGTGRPGDRQQRTAVLHRLGRQYHHRLGDSGDLQYRQPRPNELLLMVGPVLGAQAEDLVCEDGAISSNNDPSRRLKWKDATALLGRNRPCVRRWLGRGPVRRHVGGCQFIEVEVDAETGRVRPIKVVAVHDFGLCVNSLTARSQINGGVIMDLSWALLEDRLMDQNTGTMVNPNLENYKLLGPWRCRRSTS